MKKGFTLIELLAVIVILAVIALIATPIVLNIINDAKDSAKGRTAENYIHAVENVYAQSILKNTQIPDGKYTVMSNGNLCKGTLANNVCTGSLLKPELSGTIPNGGSVLILKGKIKSYNLIIDQKSITYGCYLNDSNNNNVGDKGEKVTCGTENFYIYDNLGDDYKLLSEYNLNVGANIISSDKIGIQNKNVKGWNNSGSSPYNGTVKFSNSNGWSSESNINIQNYDGPVKTAINNYKTILIQLGVELRDIRLITKQELLDLNCKYDSPTCLTALYSWVYSSSYWCESSVNNIYVLYVNSIGTLSGGDYTNSVDLGVRPVIIIPKASI